MAQNITQMSNIPMGCIHTHTHIPFFEMPCLCRQGHYYSSPSLCRIYLGWCARAGISTSVTTLIRLFSNEDCSLIQNRPLHFVGLGREQCWPVIQIFWEPWKQVYYTGYQYQKNSPQKSLQQSSYQFQCQNNNFDYQFTQFFFSNIKRLQVGFWFSKKSDTRPISILSGLCKIHNK
jgi:hypothetical protein